MSTPNIVLNVNGIGVIYNHVILVLKGVSLQVPEGGIVALLWWSWTWSGRFMAPIHAGMTMADVRSHLGQTRTVRKHTDGTESWDYRHWWSSDARVDFDTNGVVISLDIV